MSPYKGGSPAISCKTRGTGISALTTRRVNCRHSDKCGFEKSIERLFVKPFNAATLKTKMEAVFPGSAG
jgi:hypothetical protein